MVRLTLVDLPDEILGPIVNYVFGKPGKQKQIPRSVDKLYLEMAAVGPHVIGPNVGYRVNAEILRVCKRLHAIGTPLLYQGVTLSAEMDERDTTILSPLTESTISQVQMLNVDGYPPIHALRKLKRLKKLEICHTITLTSGMVAFTRQRTLEKLVSSIYSLTCGLNYLYPLLQLLPQTDITFAISCIKVNFYLTPTTYMLEVSHQVSNAAYASDSWLIVILYD